MYPENENDLAPAPVVAFFDVDNTLVRGASAYYIGRGAWRQGHVGLRDLMVFAWTQARFLAVGENQRHLAGVKERALQIVRGHRQADIVHLAEQIYDRDILPRLWPETVELAKEHLARGHQVWLITATPQIIAQVIADRLGLSGALGTLVETDADGCFTGRLLEPALHGARKGLVAREMVERLGADLDECWAYSDSINDLPLLEAVGNRVVVNPDAELAATARSRGWDALTFARDSVRAAKRRVREHTRVHGRLPRVSAAARRASRGA